MNLKIKRISIENFKGISSLSLDFPDGITQISAQNGAGKSSICDAISYCLFGKDAKGNAQFGIKTRDEKGNELLHLDHSVELALLVDGVETIIKRTLREKWSKPRGQEDEVLTGNYIDYSINGEKVTKTDYDKFVFSFAGNDLFPMLSTPSMFPQLHWSEQRNQLAKMAGDISNDDITGGETRYNALLKELEQQSLEAYRKHLSYQIRELKKTIDEMPVKIETLKATLPAQENWDGADLLLEDKQRKYDELKTNLVRYTNGNGKSLLDSQLQDKINFQNRRIEQIVQSKRNLARQEADRYEMAIRDAQKQLTDAENTKMQLVNKRASVDIIIDKCNEHLNELKTDKAMLESDWNKIKEEKFEFGEINAICPTCHQELPAEQVQQIFEDAKSTFIASLAKRKELLRKKAEVIKTDIAQTKANKEDNIELLKTCQEQIDSANEVIQQAKQRVEEAKKETAPTAQELLDKDENYISILNTIEEYKAQLNSSDTQDFSEQITETKKELCVLDEELANLRSAIANKTQYIRISKMIEDTRHDWKILNAQLTELENREDIVLSYVEKRDSILEMRVNSFFKLAKFKMFKTQVDGTKEPFCTATYNGVEYRDLNTAMKINVGLDIINALSSYYDTYVPICIDNAECVNDIIHTPSQQIQLYVGNESKLTIL